MRISLTQARDQDKVDVMRYITFQKLQQNKALGRRLESTGSS